MKKINCAFLFIWCLIPLLPSSILASIPVNTEDHPAGKISMSDFNANSYPTPYPHLEFSPKTLRQQKKDAKMEARLEKLMTRLHAKKGIDNLSDTTDRWFWLGAGSWTIGILITIIAGGTIGAVGLGIIWLLAFTFGAFSLIVWLKKRYGD